MNKIREFIWGFCWMLSCEIIGNDLGINTEGTAVWSKYITPVVLGLMWAFYFQPMRQKRRLEKDNLKL
jgi:hypothetical protein